MSLDNKIRLFLRNRIRPLYCIWFARNKKSWRKTRYILSIITGIFLTWLLCKAALAPFFFSKENEKFIIRWSIILLGSAFVFTDAVKCIIFLTFTAVLGKSGRNFLRSFAFALVIAGPIHNLFVNVGEVVRVFSCSIVLTHNLTRARFDLMTKPFQRTLAHMKDDIEDVENTFQSLKNVTSVVHEEIMGDDLVNKEFITATEESESLNTNASSTLITVEYIDNVIEVPIENENTTENESTTENANITVETTAATESTTKIPEAKYEVSTVSTTPTLSNEQISHLFLTKYKKRRKRNSPYFKRDDTKLDTDPNYVQEKYKNKMKKRCVKQLEDGKQRCKNAFQATFDKCYDALPPILNTLLCWPLKIDFVCNINFLGNPDNLCDPSDAIPDNLGKTYVNLTKVERNLYSENSNVEVSYKVMSIESSPGLQSANETAHEVMKQFNNKKEIFDAFLYVMRRILAFTILYILYACYKYHKKYKKDLQHDNVYITDYFKHIDERRRNQSKNPILPLKKYERRNIIVMGESGRQRTIEERRDAAFYLFLFFMEMFTGLFFICLDYMVSMLLQIVRDHAEVQFVQDGEHTIKFSVEGTGLIARLLRSTLHNFNMHEVVHTKLTNKQCLPKSTFLPRSFYVEFFLLYATILMLIYHSAKFLRLRRMICSYFYRKQEKRRILYLYNSIMKQRHSLIQKMIQQAKMNYVDRKVRHKANIFLKLRLQCPTCFGWLARFKVAQHKCLVCDEFEDINFIYCHTPQCGAAYCYECWIEIGDNCIICNGIIAHNITINFDDFFEDFTFIRIA